MRADSFDPRALGIAAFVALSTALASIFGEWMSYRVPVPAGFLIALLVLVLFPTGELIRLIAAWLSHATPDTSDDSNTGDSE